MRLRLTRNRSLTRRFRRSHHSGSLRDAGRNAQPACQVGRLRGRCAAACGLRGEPAARPAGGNWGIDLDYSAAEGAGCMADLSMVTVSERAWAAIEAADYVGYDALAPWRTGVADRYLPYTHNWQAMAGLRVALDLFEAEGQEAAYRRHADVASYCRDRLREIGVELWPDSEEISSPTVTAAVVPDGWTGRLDGELRKRRSRWQLRTLGRQVFRIGHMGSQANHDLVEQGMDALAEVFRMA